MKYDPMRIAAVMRMLKAVERSRSGPFIELGRGKRHSPIGNRQENVLSTSLVPWAMTAPMTCPIARVSCQVDTTAPRMFAGGNSDRYRGTQLLMMPTPPPRIRRPTTSNGLDPVTAGDEGVSSPVRETVFL
jgi:hypothetical protein